MLFEQTSQIKEVLEPASLVLEGTENIRITSIGNRNSRDSKVLSTSSTKIHTASLIMVNGSLGEHSIILELGLSQRRAVISNENQLR